MKTLHASEIGSYLFCARAWWYARQGITSARAPELAAGTRLHAAHARRVQAAGQTRTLANLLLLLALVLLAAYFTLQVV